MSDRFIVAEISKNWPEAPGDNSRILSQRFEAVIAHNLERGYILHSFQFHQLMTDASSMNETIVAVFEKTTTLKESP